MPTFLFFGGGDKVVGFKVRCFFFLQYVVIFLDPRVGEVDGLELEENAVCSTVGFSATPAKVLELQQ